MTTTTYAVRRIDWSEPWHLRRIWASAQLPQACIGTAMGLFAASGDPTAYWWVLGLALLGIAAYKGGVAIPPLPVAAAAGILTLLSWTALLTASLYDSDYVAMTYAMAMWATLMAAFVFLQPARSALTWALPLIFLHAGMTLSQGLFSMATPNYPRAVGITGTPSTGSGLLVIGIAIIALTRYRYGSVILAAALPFTGARLAMLTLGALLGLAVFRVNYRWSLLTAAVMILTVLLFWPTILAAVRYNAIDGLPAEVLGRMSMPYSSPDGVPKILQGILPLGYSGDSATHTLPARLWYEVGAAGAATWALMTWGALSRRAWSPAWWVLLTMTMIASLDYYTWMPLAVSGFWWLAIRLQFQKVKNDGRGTEGSPVRLR